MKRRKSYALSKTESNLKGSNNEITQGSDVGSEPFPFTEEDNSTKEKFHFGSVDSNEPL